MGRNEATVAPGRRPSPPERRIQTVFSSGGAIVRAWNVAHGITGNNTDLSFCVSRLGFILRKCSSSSVVVCVFSARKILPTGNFQHWHTASPLTRRLCLPIACGPGGAERHGNRAPESTPTRHDSRRSAEAFDRWVCYVLCLRTCEVRGRCCAWRLRFVLSVTMPLLRDCQPLAPTATLVGTNGS